MVDEAVDHGGSNDVVAAENSAPPGRSLVDDTKLARSYRETPAGRRGWRPRSNGMYRLVNHQERIARQSRVSSA